MKVEKNGNVTTVKFEGKKRGFEKWFLLTSDRHHDNAHCKQDLELKHLKQCKERDAHIIDIGDLFCAMQGKWDRRADTSQLRPEYVQGNYLDSLVNEAVKFYGPYADRFLQISPGNHETSICKRHETNLSERFVERMKLISEKPIFLGGYSGWIQFKFSYGRHDAINMHYHHGYGGGGPVTLGVIQHNRSAVYLPDAHIVYTGHTHDEWMLSRARVRLTNCGNLYHDEQIHLRTPGYKDEYIGGEGGWHIETGKPPKPQGAAWLRFYIDSTGKKVTYEITKAK
jgi:hypothetical protein